MYLFNSITFKPEHKQTFESVMKAFIENSKNVFVKAEPFSGAMKSIGRIAGNMEYKLYEYDFNHLEEDRWEDQLRNYFGMISRTEKIFVVFKNFEDLEDRLHKFLNTTNAFSDLDISFIIVSDSNWEGKEYVRRSTQINNDDFYYLLGISEAFLYYSIDNMNEQKYGGNIDIDILRQELKNSIELV